MSLSKAGLAGLALIGFGLLFGCGEEQPKSTEQLTNEITKNNQANAPEVPQELKNRGMMRGAKGAPPGKPAEQAPGPAAPTKK